MTSFGRSAAQQLAGALVALAALVSPLRASAQVHAGVDVAGIVPAGMEIVETRAPHRAEVPVRLSLAPRGAQAPELLVDVLVAVSTTAARTALAGQLGALSAGDPAALPGVGDVGHADDGFAAFARDNVVIVIRRIAGAHDVRALASAMDRAVLASPTGSPRADARAQQLPDVGAMAPGTVAEIALAASVLDLFIEAEGDASVRRTADGFLVRRTGSGAALLRVLVVDRRLRVLAR